MKFRREDGANLTASTEMDPTDFLHLLFFNYVHTALSYRNCVDRSMETPSTSPFLNPIVFNINVLIQTAVQISCFVAYINT